MKLHKGNKEVLSFEKISFVKKNVKYSQNERV